MITILEKVPFSNSHNYNDHVCTASLEVSIIILSMTSKISKKLRMVIYEKKKQNK